MTTIESVIVGIIVALLGGSGVVGLAFIYLRRYIDGKLDAKAAEDKKRMERRLERLKIDEEKEHATGRLFFFIHKFIVTGQHNGDLEGAWQQYQAAEESKKRLDQQILAEHQLEG